MDAYAFSSTTRLTRGRCGKYYLLPSGQSKRTLLKKKLNLSSSQLEVNKGQGLIINNPKKRNMFLVQLVLPDSSCCEN